MKILLVEHNIFTCGYLWGMLKGSAIECKLIYCTNGSEALGIALEKQPDLVVMDINEPCIDCMSALQILKNLYADIYFLIISDPKTFKQLEKTIFLEADDFLIKPFAKSELILRIKKAIRLKEKAFDPALTKLNQNIRKHSLASPAEIFTGGVVHDFNNFLATMLGNIALAKTYKNDPDKINEKLNIIEKATLQAKKLTQRLSAFAEGKKAVERVHDIKELIITNAYFALSGTNVNCKFLFPDDLPPLKIDEAQMGQIINNLIMNAVQAMPDKGTIQIEAEKFSFEAAGNKLFTALSGVPLPSGDYVKISVADEGYGISEENQPKIFQPFFSTKTGGSGLGLAISHAIVKKHGGFINFRSQAGIGTTFEVYLPAVKT
ncbi:MAG: hybrid sensor histidine kinase/response regulator [Firmicutes bacterium]|nr:hybrid sensor histidine kinase/response regulator [Bacillota bacterium]